MADTLVDIPGVGRVSFPSSMTDHDIRAASARLYSEHAAQAKATTAQGISNLSSQLGITPYMAKVQGVGPAAASDIAEQARYNSAPQVKPDASMLNPMNILVGGTQAFAGLNPTTEDVNNTIATMPGFGGESARIGQGLMSPANLALMVATSGAGALVGGARGVLMGRSLAALKAAHEAQLAGDSAEALASFTRAANLAGAARITGAAGAGAATAAGTYFGARGLGSAYEGAVNPLPGQSFAEDPGAYIANVGGNALLGAAGLYGAAHGVGAFRKAMQPPDFAGMVNQARGVAPAEPPTINVPPPPGLPGPQPEVSAPVPTAPLHPDFVPPQEGELDANANPIVAPSAPAEPGVLPAPVQAQPESALPPVQAPARTAPESLPVAQTPGQSPAGFQPTHLMKLPGGAPIPVEVTADNGVQKRLFVKTANGGIITASRSNLTPLPPEGQGNGQSVIPGQNLVDTGAGLPDATTSAPGVQGALDNANAAQQATEVTPEAQAPDVAKDAIDLHNRLKALDETRQTFQAMADAGRGSKLVTNQIHKVALRMQAEIDKFAAAQAQAPPVEPAHALTDAVVSVARVGHDLQPTTEEIHAAAQQVLEEENAQASQTARGTGVSETSAGSTSAGAQPDAQLEQQRAGSAVAGAAGEQTVVHGGSGSAPTEAESIAAASEAIHRLEYLGADAQAHKTTEGIQAYRDAYKALVKATKPLDIGHPHLKTGPSAIRASAARIAQMAHERLTTKYGDYEGHGEAPEAQDLTESGPETHDLEAGGKLFDNLKPGDTIKEPGGPVTEVVSKKPGSIVARHSSESHPVASFQEASVGLNYKTDNGPLTRIISKSADSIRVSPGYGVTQNMTPAEFNKAGYRLVGQPKPSFTIKKSEFSKDFDFTRAPDEFKLAPGKAPDHLTVNYGKENYVLTPQAMDRLNALNAEHAQARVATLDKNGAPTKATVAMDRANQQARETLITAHPTLREVNEAPDEGLQEMHAGLDPRSALKGLQALGLAPMGEGTGHFRAVGDISPTLANKVCAANSAPESGATLAQSFSNDIMRDLTTPEDVNLFERLILHENAQRVPSGNVPTLSPQEEAEWNNWVATGAGSTQWSKVGEALARYQSAAKPDVLAKTKKTSPGMTVATTPNDAYMRLFPMTDSKGNPIAANQERKSGGARGPLANRTKLKRATNVRHAFGTGQDYRQDFRRNLEQTYSDVTFKAALADVMTSARAEGWAVPESFKGVTSKYNGIDKTFTLPNGEVMPGVLHVLKGQRYPITHPDSGAVLGYGGKDQYVYIPQALAQALDEITAPARTPTGLAAGWDKIQNATVAIQLASPAHFAWHVYRVLANGSHMATDAATQAGNIRLQNYLPNLGPLHGAKIQFLYDIWNTDMSDPENFKVLQDIMEAGGGSFRPFQEAEGNILSAIGHEKLFGFPEGQHVLGGFDLRARVVLEKLRRLAEGNKDPQRTRDYLNQLGQYTRNPDYIISKVRELNRYAATQLPQKLLEYKRLVGDTGLKANSPRGAATIRLASIGAGVVALIVGRELVKYMFTGKLSQKGDDPEVINLGHGITLPLRDLDPGLSRAGRDTGLASMIAGKGEKQAGMDIVNNASTTVDNVPENVLLGVGLGVAPWGQYDRQGNPTALRIAPKGATLGRRVAATAMTMNPILQGAGDIGGMRNNRAFASEPLPWRVAEAIQILTGKVINHTGR